MSQFSAQNQICRQQFEVCKENDKKNSIPNLMTELELYTEFVSHNLVHKTEFVSHNLVHKTEFVSHHLVHKTEFVSHSLVHKTEFVDNNLKFAYEMTMEFND